jgi:hypothetical protein
MNLYSISNGWDEGEALFFLPVCTTGGFSFQHLGFITFESFLDIVHSVCRRPEPVSPAGNPELQDAPKEKSVTLHPTTDAALSIRFRGSKREIPFGGILTPALACASRRKGRKHHTANLLALSHFGRARPSVGATFQICGLRSRRRVAETEWLSALSKL